MSRRLSLVVFEMPNHPELFVNKRSMFENVVDFMSFNHEVRHLVEILNSEIAAPDTVVFRPFSHPAGFVRLITKRRLTIAEAYIRLLSHAQNTGYTERIEALQVMMHHVWHAKNLSMPLNTARVQIALMKQAVRMRGNQRAQLELMSDFARASYGKATVIRRLLRERDLIEVPETGEDLCALDLGWDDHVHDSMTEGRKSPTQLVLDAFIKGISRITVAYYDATTPDTYEEIYLASRILGIDVRIGIEFSIGKKFDRTHYMYVAPQGKTYEELSAYLAQNREKLTVFWKGLQCNSRHRHETVSALLESFNRTGLVEFNAPYEGQSHLQMAPLSWDDLEKLTPKSQATRVHLGQLIYQSMRPVALKRVLYLKNLYRDMVENETRDVTVTWEEERCRRRYNEAVEEYEALSPALCAQRYVTRNKEIDYDSSFATASDILPLLSSCGGEIVFIHPLSQGLVRGIETLFRDYANITSIEVFNLVDALSRDTAEIRKFSTFLGALSSESAEHVASLLSEWNIDSISIDQIKALQAHVREKPFAMRCASDAVGWSSNIPGMGFIRGRSLSAKSRRLFDAMQHLTLPKTVSDLMRGDGDDDGQDGDVYLMSSTQIPMGPNRHAVPTRPSPSISPLRFWRYLNLNLRCLILALIGFIPGYYCLGLEYAVIWFVITGFRNVIVDWIASSGIVPSAWRLRDIDRENMCESLFFSGISVPILAGAKMGFDASWAWFGFDEGFLFTFCKFWAIAFANGLYLVSHNTLRGFDKAAIRGNFFRSVLSWPLATIGSYALTPIGVPDVVQSKIWSEVVAGFIEGTVKNIKQKRLAQKAVFEVYKQIISSNALYVKTACMDILFFWSKYGQGRRVLERFMSISHRKIANITPEERAQIEQGNRIIYRTFTTTGSLESLTNVVLAYYPEENLALLTDFVGTTHAPFVRWIQRTDAAGGS